MRFDKMLENKTVWIMSNSFYRLDEFLKLFIGHGAKIIIVGDAATGEAMGYTAFHCAVAFYECDPYDYESIERVCDAILAEHGAPDVYQHMADKYGAAYIDELDYGEFEKMLAISVVAPFAAMRRIAGPMSAKGGGSVIFIAGYYGIRAINRVSGYGACKGGQISLARSLAAEYAGAGIRVNAIVPGASFPPVGDELLAQSGSADTDDFWFTVQPFRRRGRLEELAHAALFLASEMSSGVTGEALIVDGAGHLIAHNHFFPHIKLPSE